MPLHFYLGADHAGFKLKEELKRQLFNAGHVIEDMGAFSEERVDYPDPAKAVAEKVAATPEARGILVCGSGIGMSIAANKVAGVRAALVHDETTARLARQHNDANLLCLGARTTGVEVAKLALEIFIATPFDGGRHAGRIEKIHALEK